MLRITRSNTYKAVMPHLDSEFYEFVEAEDEEACSVLAKYIVALITKSKQLCLFHAQNHANAMYDHTHINRNHDHNSPANDQAQTSPGHDLIHTDTTHDPAHTLQSGYRAQWLHRLLSGVRRKQVPVFLPEDFISRVVRDVIRMVEGEHQGIRGCVLVVEVCQGLRSVTLGKIVCDPWLPLTYTLTLQLTLAPTPDTHHTSRFQSKGTEEAIFISPGYTIEKTRPKCHTC